MQIIKNQVLDILSRLIKENPGNEDLINQLQSIKKLVALF